MPKLDDAAAEIRKLYETGSTLEEIAARFNVSKQAVHYRLKAVGVEFRSTGQTRALIDRETLERLYVEKWLNAREIADHLGCQIGIVYKDLEHHGIDRRVRGHISRKYPQLRELNIGESRKYHGRKRNGSIKAISIRWLKQLVFACPCER